jgi:hypothetical protein
MTIVIDAMNKYSSLASLSVVYHNQMLTPRSNPKTEAARIKALDAMLAEFSDRKAFKKATKALQAFHKAKDKDNTFEPMFKVI